MGLLTVKNVPLRLLSCEANPDSWVSDQQDPRWLKTCS